MGSFSDYSQDFIHPRWLFGISSTDSSDIQRICIPPQGLTVRDWKVTVPENNRKGGVFQSHHFPFGGLGIRSQKSRNQMS